MKKRFNTVREYRTLFWLFVAGSVVGFILEGVFAIIKRGAWENHSALVWGPFCIVYGIGACAMYLVSKALNDRSFLEQFLMFALAGSVVEYVCSFLQEHFFGSKSWDYSDRFMNIRGRICLQMTLIWGFLGLTFVRLIFPSLIKLTESFEIHTPRILCAAFAVFMVVNLLVSAAAVLRWQERRLGIPPDNRIEEYLDEKYGEDVMERVYGNMEFDGSQADE